MFPNRSNHKFCLNQDANANRPPCARSNVKILSQQPPPGFGLTSGASAEFRRPCLNCSGSSPTPSRAGKKLVEYCGRQGFAHHPAELPFCPQIPGKSVVFQKPLFPGYVFCNFTLRMPPPSARTIMSPTCSMFWPGHLCAATGRNPLHSNPARKSVWPVHRNRHAGASAPVHCKGIEGLVESRRSHHRDPAPRLHQSSRRRQNGRRPAGVGLKFRHAHLTRIYCFHFGPLFLPFPLLLTQPRTLTLQPYGR